MDVWYDTGLVKVGLINRIPGCYFIIHTQRSVKWDTFFLMCELYNFCTESCNALTGKASHLYTAIKNALVRD